MAPRDRLPSVDEISAERPAKRESSADSFPVMTDDKAELILIAVRKLDSDVGDLMRKMSDQLNRDAEQEKRLAELEAFKKSIVDDAKKEAGKTATRWSSIGTVLGIVIASAATAGLSQCRWVQPPVQQLTPTPKANVR